MKKICLSFFCLLLVNLGFSQTDDIENVKLELYGGPVNCISIMTEGKEMQLYYSEKHNQIISKNQFEQYPDTVYYPIVARVRIFKKSNSTFPDNLSVRIDFEYIKRIQGSLKAIQINSPHRIRTSKILGKDRNDENKFYVDRGEVNPDELLLYKTEDVYRLGYLEKSTIVGFNLFIRDLRATIKDGVRE
jgi:hypothetical protein